MPRQQPFIVIPGNIFDEKSSTVYCERVKVVSGVNFWQAMLSTYYLYYIFNLKYPTDEDSFFEHFDKLLANC